MFSSISCHQDYFIFDLYSKIHIAQSPKTCRRIEDKCCVKSLLEIRMKNKSTILGMNFVNHLELFI